MTSVGTCLIVDDGASVAKQPFPPSHHLDCPPMLGHRRNFREVHTDELEANFLKLPELYVNVSSLTTLGAKSDRSDRNSSRLSRGVI